MDQSRCRDFDATRFLDNEETIAAYLTDAVNDPNPELFISALSDVTRANGITALAKKTGLDRGIIYKALMPRANPGYGTLTKILTALNVKFLISPL